MHLLSVVLTVSTDEDTVGSVTCPPPYVLIITASLIAVTMLFIITVVIAIAVIVLKRQDNADTKFVLPVYLEQCFTVTAVREKRALIGYRPVCESSLHFS